MNNRTKAILAMVGAMLLFVLADSTVKVLARSLGPMTQTYIRLFLASAITLVLFNKHIRLKSFLTASSKTIKWVFITGAIGFGVKAMLFTLGLINTNLLNVSSIDTLTPLAVYLYSMILFRTKFDVRMLIFILISIYGVLIVSTKSLVPVISQFGIGELFISGSIFMTALSIIGRKVLVGKLNNFEVAASTNFLASLILFFLANIFGEKLILSNFNFLVLRLLFFIAFLTSIAAILVNYSLTKLESILVSQILLIKIIFSLIIGFILLKELPRVIEIVGSLVIIGGVYLSNEYRSLIKEKKI